MLKVHASKPSKVPGEKAFMAGNDYVVTVKSVVILLITAVMLMMSFNALATTVNYTFDNIILDNNEQLTGTFTWT